MIYALLILAVLFWLCTPANLIIPELPDAPYNIHHRPPPPQDKFLKDAVPKSLNGFTLVDLRQEQVFEEPYIGANTIQATYVDNLGHPVTVVLIEAESYINARRYLENYKKLIQERTTPTEWQEKLHIEDNFIQWAAPDFADRAYGIAWNNGRYFIAVTSPVQEAEQAIAAQFPY
jgi:hypothetical protein